MSATSLSLFPDVSTAYHSAPTIQEMHAKDGVDMARQFVLEGLIDQTESEWIQVQVARSDPEAPPEIPVRSALSSNMPFHTMENRILNENVPNLSAASAANGDAWYQATQSVSFGLFPDFLDANGSTPGCKDSRPCAAATTWTGRTLDIADSGIYETAAELLAQIELGRPADIQKKTDGRQTETRPSAHDPLGAFSPPSTKRQVRPWSEDSQRRTPTQSAAPKPSQFLAPQGFRLQRRLPHRQ